MNLTLVDLFAGCGGLSLGLELAGFVPVLAAELNNSARATYVANRDGSVHVETDVRQLADAEPSKLRRLAGLGRNERVTLVAGGPPCQGFSGIGHRRTHSDVEKHEIASNHLYKDMISVIDKLQPEAFLFENVRGLLSARWSRDDPRKVWDRVRRHFLRTLGDRYVIAYDVVRAYEFGVPQNRPRVLMVGLREERWEAIRELAHPSVRTLSRQAINACTARDEQLATKALLLPPALSPERRREFLPDMEELLGDLIDPSWEAWAHAGCKGAFETCAYPAAARAGWQHAMRAAVSGDGVATRKGAPLAEQAYSRHAAHVRARFGLIRQGKEVPEAQRTKKFAQRALPATWGDRAPGITVASLPDDYVHFAQSRSLTVREWARLQGFPDWYQFKGPRTTGGDRRAGDVRSGETVREAPRYTQIGNAVPVPLAAAIGWQLRRCLASAEPDESRGHHAAPLARFLRAALDRELGVDLDDSSSVVQYESGLCK
ncbi:MAG: DNA cytosine methyltransferase [Gemmatimonadaceae bacterium]|nr:DNA cytosine methyltransferase [Gemmatimonadaceae bacterium]